MDLWAMKLKNYFYEASNVKIGFIEDNLEQFQKVIDIIIECLKNWNKLLICGNGWSAADAQHWAAELIGRYKIERQSLPAIALTTDSSILTAIWNDYGYDQVFSKQVEWLWLSWDIFIGISTSWNSENIIKAVEIAKSKWLITIWLLGKWGGKLKNMMDYSLVVPSDNTPRIQECHLTIYHTICEMIDEQYK